MADFTAAATAYATWGQPMIPFFIFYSMFGFQRVGDLIWSFGDQRGRGFLMGATAGRTTLTGEGLQHCDGQSQMYAMAYPNCRAYDPAFAYEVGGDRPRRHPAHVRPGTRGLLLLPRPSTTRTTCSRPMPERRRGRHRARHLPLPRAPTASARTARRSSRAGRWCCRRSKRSSCSPSTTTSPPTCGASPGWKQLRDDAIDCERWNRLHPTEAPRTPYVTEQLDDAEGPIVAVTDWVKAVPDSIARFVPQPYVVLGTDGYGFSDIAAGAAPPLRGRRRPHRGRGARRARPDRRRQGRGGRRGASRATRSTPRRPIPATRLT